MKIAVDFFFESISKINEAVCGDRVIYSYDEDRFICVLADGLGSGVKANILATMTATILHRLLKENVPLFESIATLSATLPECKERNIAYSTFSLLQIDSNGKATLVEFDNPALNVLTNQQVRYIHREKREYENRTIYYSEFDVFENDLLVMISDGVLYAGMGNTLNFGWQESDMLNHLIQTTSCNDHAHTIGKYLINTVSNLYENKPQDDASVVVCKINKQTQSVVMIGPPRLPVHDKKIVDELNQATGLKMVCGGTTAQIVARELEQRVVVDETFLYNSDLPPTAFIEGIDFVSEGILTLGRLVDLFLEASTNKQYKELLCETKPKDGAHYMFQLLMLKCNNIIFYVGQADNQAHSYLSQALSVNMKNNLVARIAGYLQEFGKVVTIYHV